MHKLFIHLNHLLHLYSYNLCIIPLYPHITGYTLILAYKLKCILASIAKIKKLKNLKKICSPDFFGLVTKQSSSCAWVTFLFRFN